jgi:tetratricopeptide (TPR) repeat protein
MKHTAWREAMGLLGAIALAAGMLSVAGCKAQHAQALQASQSAYRAGDYSSAYRDARAVYDNPAASREDRDNAAYMIGLAAYRTRDLDTAQEFLQIAADSADPSLSADASVQLGLVYSERGKFGLAADALHNAAGKLTGPDQANAYFYAGVAEQKEGRWPQARTTLSMAMSSSRDPAFRERVADQLRVTGYTLQIGAFDVESNAQRSAQVATARAEAFRYATPRVVMTTDPANGHKRYLVWVGQFSSWPTALMARDNLGITNAVVTALTQ